MQINELKLRQERKRDNFINKPWSTRGWDSLLRIVLEVGCAMCGLILLLEVPMTWERPETIVDKSVFEYQLELDAKLNASSNSLVLSPNAYSCFSLVSDVCEDSGSFPCLLGSTFTLSFSSSSLYVFGMKYYDV